MSVYVIQNHAVPDEATGLLKAKYDLSAAEEFGELVYLLSPIKVPNRPQEVIHQLQEKLSNFSDDDFLLLVGNPCFIGWATAIAAGTNNGRVQMLQWNGRRKRYYAIRAKNLI